MRNRLDGMCLYTIVLTRPMRFDSQAATGNENAPSVLDQKKNRLAPLSERSKRSKSHSASIDCTASPPANESTLNSAASLYTLPREGPIGVEGVSRISTCGRRR